MPRMVRRFPAYPGKTRSIVPTHDPSAMPRILGVLRMPRLVESLARRPLGKTRATSHPAANTGIAGYTGAARPSNRCYASNCRNTYGRMPPLR